MTQKLTLICFEAIRNLEHWHLSSIDWRVSKFVDLSEPLNLCLVRSMSVIFAFHIDCVNSKNPHSQIRIISLVSTVSVLDKSRQIDLYDLRPSLANTFITLGSLGDDLMVLVREKFYSS